VTLTSRAPSALHAAIGFCQGTPMRGEIEALDPCGLEATTEAAANAVRAEFGDGPIEAPMQAVVVAVRQTEHASPHSPHPEEAAKRPSRRVGSGEVRVATLRDAPCGRSSG